MNKRFLSVLLFAFVVAGAASFLVYRLVASRLEANVRPGHAKTLLATHELPVGMLIKDVDVQFADWGGAIPSQGFSKPEEVIGRGVVATIYQGEPVMQNRLAAKGAGAGLAATIPMGMRAVAVRVNEVVGLAGFVVPGMRVDVLVEGTPPGGAQSLSGNLSKTILQNIQVLSAGQKIEKNNDGRPESVGVVNLLVTPEQAEVMSLASNETRIQLVLRNPLDTQETKTSGTATANLFSGVAYTGQAFRTAEIRPPGVRGPVRVKTIPIVRTPVAEATKPPTTVEMIHGMKKTEEKFEELSGRP
ncbi:MAG: Flp pilus assembly protein CpaB [Acidobacteriota bacterium]|nr:Flp pilus assembly protein CpaB [Acidobacteriota bacterium]